MHRPVSVLLLTTLLTAACTNTGGLGASDGSPFAPTGSDAGGVEADPLIVGHRLMEADEAELALRAYYRAGADLGLTAEVLSAIGSANLRLGRLGQAEKNLRQALKSDQTSVPAWNNLGVVLMEKGEVAEASRIFRTAFALDSGQSDDIRENLRLALAQIQNPEYEDPNEKKFSLVRRGNGEYLLLSKH
jgi:tetratricopeptide (TPR) repeat protein